MTDSNPQGTRPVCFGYSGAFDLPPECVVYTVWMVLLLYEVSLHISQRVVREAAQAAVSTHAKLDGPHGNTEFRWELFSCEGPHQQM